MTKAMDVNTKLSKLNNIKYQLVNFDNIAYAFNSSDSWPLNCLSTSLKLGVNEAILLHSSEDSVYTPSTRPFIYKIQNNNLKINECIIKKIYIRNKKNF